MTGSVVNKRGSSVTKTSDSGGQEDSRETHRISRELNANNCEENWIRMLNFFLEKRCVKGSETFK